MPCWKRPDCAFPNQDGERSVGLWPGILLALCLAVFASGARAEAIAVKSAQVEAADEGYVLNAEFTVTLNATVEEALDKGIPLYFLLEFELDRPRRFWFDEKIVRLERSVKLSYNALTRQYRLASGALYQNFDSLNAALGVLERVYNLPVAGKDVLEKGVEYRAAMRLRLDVSQLPKPFQITSLASREWTLTSDWYRFKVTP